MAVMYMRIVPGRHNQTDGQAPQGLNDRRWYDPFSALIQTATERLIQHHDPAKDTRRDSSPRPETTSQAAHGHDLTAPPGIEIEILSMQHVSAQPNSSLTSIANT